MTDVIFGAITAPLDVRLSANEQQVMQSIAEWRLIDINDVVYARGITLDALCRRLRDLPRPVVFASVARLEDLGYLPMGAIR
ncbi:hypothetical protein [Micromonospora sp. NPDC050495]|uniref:hypothetical protein n=1 Tax=Micromonospora sp. NPDC050495 TaxID=3154936 RepID=UPI0033F854EC